MITKIHIDGFKGLDKFNISGFSKINLLYGLNNSGKTSVLEAIGMGMNPFYMSEDRYLTKYAPEKPILDWFRDPVSIEINGSGNNYLSTYYNINIPLDLSHWSEFSGKHVKCINFKTAIAALNYNNQFIIPQQPSLTSNMEIELASITDEEIRVIFFNEYLNNPSFQSFVEAQVVNFIKNHKNDQRIQSATPSIYFFCDQTSGVDKKTVNTILEKTALKHKVVEILQKIDDTIADYFFNNVAELRIKLNNETSQPMVYMGDGIKKIFNLLNVLLASGAKTVMIDELDNGLHPMAYGKIFTVLNELSRQENIQFFITSHNPEFVKNMAEFAMETKTENDIRFFNLLKNQEGLHWATLHEPQYMHQLLTAQNHPLIW